MPPDWIVLALVVVTARWWWAVGATLLDDLRAVSEYSEAPSALPHEHSGNRWPRTVVLEDSRVPLNRVLAFRGVSRRRAARGRWEAGFGRRGL